VTAGQRGLDEARRRFGQQPGGSSLSLGEWTVRRLAETFGGAGACEAAARAGDPSARAVLAEWRQSVWEAVQAGAPVWDGVAGPPEHNRDR
jgi:hypothetical protein